MVDANFYAFCNYGLVMVMMMMMIMMMMIERIGLVTIMMIMAVYVDAHSDSTQATTRDDWQTHTSQREGEG